MDTELFYSLKDTGINNQLETIVDGISERTVIRTLSSETKITGLIKYRQIFIPVYLLFSLNQCLIEWSFL